MAKTSKKVSKAEEIKSTQYVRKRKKYKLKRFHISFKTRVLFFSIFFVFSFSLGLYYVINSLNVWYEENLYYKESGKVNYSVCLNSNDFFENNCLSENMSYVASLIKNINLNFNYRLDTNKDDYSSKLEYEIVGKLVIKNADTATNYFEKEYILQDKTNDGLIVKDKTYEINKNIDINYEYYNNIANKFKAQYGVDSQSYLEVSFIRFNDESSNDSSNKISIEIPLSQKAIEIKLNTQAINNVQDKQKLSKHLNVINWIRITCGSLLLLFSFYYLINFIKLLWKARAKQNAYDKYLAKIMKGYDRLIVNTKSIHDFKDYNILKIDSFDELIDVRDNLRLPIMFYELEAHEKAHFYILQENNMYLYTLKNADLENKK